MLTSLLRRLESGQLPSDLTSRFINALGNETFDALVRARILIPKGPLDRYPCPQFGEACPRWVQRAPEDLATPFRAVSRQPGLCCPTLSLTEEEVQGHVFDRAAFVRVLRQLFHVEGRADLTQEAFAFGWYIGEQREPRREVFFCTNLTSSLGAAGALELRLSHRRQTLALSHALHKGIPNWLHQCRTPGLALEVVFLDEVLVARQGLIVRDHQSPLIPEPLQAPTTAHCLLLSHEGRRSIDEATYHGIAAHHADHDLFIDATRAVKGGRFFASKRDDNGKVTLNPLTTQHAHALIELIQRKQPMRATEINALNEISTPDKQLERARRQIDVKLSRYQWRAFHTLRGHDGHGKRYVFKPPKDFAFAVFVSLVS